MRGPERPRPVASVEDVVRRLIRIESKLHALSKALNVDLNANWEAEGWGNQPR